MPRCARTPLPRSSCCSACIWLYSPFTALEQRPSTRSLRNTTCTSAWRPRHAQRRPGAVPESCWRNGATTAGCACTAGTQASGSNAVEMAEQDGGATMTEDAVDGMDRNSRVAEPRAHPVPVACLARRNGVSLWLYLYRQGDVAIAHGFSCFYATGSSGHCASLTTPPARPSAAHAALPARPPHRWRLRLLQMEQTTDP